MNHQIIEEIFLKNFNEPEYVVCDGQNGLIKAIKSVWFNVKIKMFISCVNEC